MQLNPSTQPDLDPSRRPGVPRHRIPAPWPNTRYPPQQQLTLSSVPRHGRPGKPMPPVYGTAAPLHALSGVIRKTAYRYPDHWLRHWLMLLFADRVDLFEARTRRLLPLAIVAVPLAVSARHVLAKRRLGPTRRIRARWGAASR